MKPRIDVTIDGQPVAGHFYNRLVSATITDNEGGEADTFDIELNDGPPDFLAIPRKGAVADIQLGYGDQLVSIGQFTVDKNPISCLPYKMAISGKSADLRDSKLKERQERNWDKKKLSDIVSEIAKESGLIPAVDEEIGSYEYAWLAQEDETNIHFLERLAQRHNALFAVKQGRLIFAKKGSGHSASGAFVGTVIVTPDIIVQGTCKFEANDRTKYKKVVAYYQDKNKAERIEVEAEGDGEGDSVYRIPEPFADAAEADKAAQAKSNELKRGEGSVSVTVAGDPAIIAGAPLLFSGVRPGLDGVPYIIKKVTHKFGKSGFTTAIDAKLYDGKSSGKSGGKTPKSGETGSSSVSSADSGKVAPNSPAGTPATPSQWATRRYGSTDAN
jgi:phage protein D